MLNKVRYKILSAPTTHAKRDTNVKYVVHNVLAEKKQAPTEDANKAPILGTRRTGTLFCVVSLHDTKSLVPVVVGP